jgi:hypothetical protein
MIIANPLYDHVFKYMMADIENAKLFISEIIGEEVCELAPQSAEIIGYDDNAKPMLALTEEEKKSLLYSCRLDYQAKIITALGAKKVAIELQKALAEAELTRFRRYLGRRYDTDKLDEMETPPQLYSIYLLGHNIDLAGNYPVLRVYPEIIDVETNTKLENVHNTFIEALHHCTWIVQVRQLNPQKKSSLMQLLALFDQHQRIADAHFLEINEKNFPEKYYRIIRSLQAAGSDKPTRQGMQLEDELLIEFHLRDKKLALSEQRAEQEKQHAEQEKQRAEQEKRRADEAEKHVEEEKQHAKEEKQRADEAEKKLAEQEALIAEMRRRINDNPL